MTLATLITPSNPASSNQIPLLTLMPGASRSLPSHVGARNFWIHSLYYICIDNQLSISTRKARPKMSYGAPFFHLMKIAFLPLLRSVPQLSRIPTSASVKEPWRCYPTTRMTMKCWCAGQSSLSTSEKSPFSTYRPGGRKRLFLRPKLRYRLHRR